ncbi:polysaccharide biosynthesis tyrosine autokinase [Olivibacter sp. SDN3]|uniref:GumC family protein n=1 Tax=Olivibacter sp. SDN3 TaxID=2764720 RepID=UPI001650E9CB|nr:polysaccharide biosynthesis tyrosine autokinase [Olivibacter sp. SDN3]QNL51711.1 polysaccharide biosynthesis tyrosine autokinase [Olivibacter sp. SDN3]
MVHQQSNLPPYGYGVEETPPKGFRELWQKYSYHWPLFFCCLFFALTAAFLYVRTLQPVFHVKAKIGIKDEKKSTMEKFALEELNIAGSPKQAESEVEIIKSRALIQRVINDLQLYVHYSLDETYRSIDLYNTTPIVFNWLEKHGQMRARTYAITIIDQQQFELTKENGDVLHGTFDDHFSSDIGLWKLDVTPHLDEFIGRTIILELHRLPNMISHYQNEIAVTLNKQAPIIDLSLNDVVPERGEAVLNHLIAAYKNYNVIDKNQETENTLKFIDDRLISITGELNNVERDVEGYKSSIGLTDISSKSQYYLENVQLNDARMNEVDVQLNVIDGIEAYVYNSEAEGTPATIGITDPGLIGLVEQLSKLQIQKQKLLATTPEGNPIFAPINKQINSTKVALNETIKGIKSSLLATRKQLEKNNNKFESSIRNIPGQERKYVSIKRQQGIKESLYVYLLQKREEVAMSYASTITDARTIEEAYYEEPKTEKSFPFAIALLTGFMLPIGLIYSRELIRNKVLTKKDIEAITAVPVICELIQTEKNASIVLQSDKRYAISEQMRVLRTNLLQEHYERVDGKVTLFTSSIAGEGKSFVVSNMGVALAASGKKTIILELDLRKPRISKIFEMDNVAPGLSSLLAGEVAKEDIILASSLQRDLYVMPSGPVPENPSELLESERMKQLLTELRNEYDHILIDSPPLHLVTDALILAPLTELSLYVVRHNYTPKEELKFVDEVYKANKLPNMKLVFNGVQMDKRFGYSLDYSYYAEKSSKQSFWHAIFGNFFNRF